MGNPTYALGLRILSLLRYIFREHRTRIAVYLGLYSFLTFFLMGTTCLFTYMYLNSGYESRLAQERQKRIDDAHEQIAKVSVLKGELSAYRDVISAFSRKGKRKDLGYFMATAYDPGKSCKPYDDGLTAALLPAGVGVAAVDPGVIPYGSILYSPDINRYFLACDTGSAIKKNGGRNIDLLMPTEKQALNFGRRKLKFELIDFSKD